MYNSLDVSQYPLDNIENMSPQTLNRGPDLTVPSPSLKRKRQETESSEMIREKGFRVHLKGLVECLDDLKDFNVG